MDAVRGRGYNGDLLELMWQNDKMATKENNLMHNNVVGDTHRRHPTELLHKPMSMRDAIWAWMNEMKAVLRIIRSILHQIITLGYTNTKRGLMMVQYLSPSRLSYGGGAHSSNWWENLILAV